MHVHSLLFQSLQHNVLCALSNDKKINKFPLVSGPGTTWSISGASPPQGLIGRVFYYINEFSSYK